MTDPEPHYRGGNLVCKLPRRTIVFDVSPDHLPKPPEEPEEPAQSIDLHGIVDAISTSSLRSWAARYRAIGISDLPLGTLGCQAEKLLDF